MRPRDWFAVGVRLFGVYVFYRGVTDLLSVIGTRVAYSAHSELSSDYERIQPQSLYYAVHAVGYFALTYVLIAGAERITRWAFGETGDTANRSGEPGGPGDRPLPPNG